MKAVESAELGRENLSVVRRHLKDGKSLLAYEGLIAILADVVDSAASGSECYCTFGLSRNRDKVMLTVTIGREKLYATGSDLLEVSKAALDLL